MSELPIVYRHQTDGKWRVRYRDPKGRIRVDKFIEGLHEPGIDGESPPLTEGHTFRTIPKAIRNTHTAPVEEAPAIEPEPSERSPEPQQVPTVEPETVQLQVEPTQQAESPQLAPPQEATPERTIEAETAKTEAFPEFCEDARRVDPISDSAPQEAPNPTESASKPIEIPVVEMLIDGMFQMGEQLGGPRAPGGSAVTAGLTLESLREMMIKSGREAFPKAEVEAGPKTTFFGCMGLYLFICTQHENFRTNTAPWWQRAKERAGLWWHRTRTNWKQKRAARTSPKEEKEDSEDA